MKKKCEKKKNIGFGTNVIKIIENVKISNDDKVTWRKRDTYKKTQNRASKESSVMEAKTREYQK